MMAKINKKTIELFIFLLSVLFAALFVFYLFLKEDANIIKNHSFESGADDWNITSTGKENLTLRDVAQSPAYPLDSRYLDKTIYLKYTPFKFSGDFSKSIIMFSFYDQYYNEINRMTYVLNGTQDHGAYQNYAVNNVGYATKILSESIKFNSENTVDLNLIQDFNVLARKNNFPILNQNEINSIEFVFATSGNEQDSIEVKYDNKSFLDLLPEGEKNNYQIVDIKNKSIENDSAIYLTNYLPTNSDKYLNICSRIGLTFELSQNLKLEPKEKYLVLMDTKIHIGRNAPSFTVQKENGEKILSDSINVNMSQTGWSTFGGIFETDSENYKLSMFVENAPDNSYYNCVNFDNMRMYKLSKIDKFFPWFLEKRLKISTNNNIVKPFRISYESLYSSDFKNKLAKEYQEKIDVPIYDLYLNEDDFWQTDVRFDYSDAYFFYNNNKYRTKIRIRGDTSLHWGAPVKSWRIDFKDPGYFQGKKSFNLIRPVGRDYLSGFFSYYLAEKLGLITLDDKFIFLRINNKPYGLMYELEDWSSDILEKNQKPVGNLYGENNDVGDKTSLSNFNLYQTSPERSITGWKKYASHPATSKNDFTDMFLLSESMVNNDYEYYKNLVDSEQFIYWNIHSILGGSVHQDIIHNNRPYFNNTSGLFEFVPWDIRLNTIDGQIGLVKYNPFLDLLLTDKKIFNERNRLLFQYVNDEKNSVDDQNFYLDAYDKIKEELFLLDNYDVLGNNISSNLFIEREILKENFKNQYERIKKNFSKDIVVKSYFFRAPSRIEDKNVFQMEIGSEDKNDFDLFNIKNVISKSGNIVLYRDNGDRVFDTNDRKINSEDINDLLDSRFHYETYVRTAPQAIEKGIFENILNMVKKDSQDFLLTNYKLNSEKGRYFIQSGVDHKNSTLTGILKSFGLIPEYESALYFIEAPGYSSLQDIVESVSLDIETSVGKNKVAVDKIIGKISDITLRDVDQSQKYPLDLQYVNKILQVKYTPFKFSGIFSKSVIFFSFYDENNNEINRMTYVLNGTQDHGLYQNYAVNNVGYATEILSDSIQLNKENIVSINPFKDFNDLARERNFPVMKETDVSGVKFTFTTSSDQKGQVEVRYDESFKDFMEKNSVKMEMSKNFYINDLYKEYVNLEEFNFDTYTVDEFLDKYPIFSKSEDTHFAISLKQGEYVVDETIVIPENFPLKIESGVTLKFASKASLVSYSTISAIGEDKNKIIFTSEKHNGDWGAVAILRAPEKSVFENSVFEKGGEAFINNVYFSGMLSVYHADAEVRNSIFEHGNEKNGDDALNLKNGLFIVEGNRFYKNNFDALDIDFATAGSYVEKNEFIQNGNDGMDISGSSGLKVVENNVSDSGDKCISIGENSDVAVTGNNLDDCNFGIAVKDGSSVYFTENRVVHNNVGAAVYNKKEIFQGGYLEIGASEFSGNGQDFGLEIIPSSDVLRSYDKGRYASKCYITDSKYKTSSKKTKEIIKEPKEKIKSKKQLLKLKIFDNMEDVGYKFAVLKDYCEVK